MNSHGVGAADDQMFLFAAEHAGQQTAVKENFRQRYFDFEDQVAEFASTFARGGE